MLRKLKEDTETFNKHKEKINEIENANNKIIEIVQKIEVIPTSEVKFDQYIGDINMIKLKEDE